MAKKIAVLIRDRQEEGLRMAVGLTLKDDKIDVYVLDRRLEESANNDLNLETLEMLEAGVFSNSKENENLPFLSTEEIADKVLDCDSVVSY